MALKRFFVVITLIAHFSAEAAMIHAAAGEIKPTEPTMRSAAAVSDEKPYIAPRGTFFNPPRLPPTRMKARAVIAP